MKANVSLAKKKIQTCYYGNTNVINRNMSDINIHMNTITYYDKMSLCPIIRQVCKTKIIRRNTRRQNMN